MRSRLQRRLLLVCLPLPVLAALGLLLAGRSAVPEEGALNPTAVQQKVNALANDPIFKNGFLGFELVDASTGERLASYNADKAFQMASVMKLYSTAFALDVLGPDYRFETGLSYTGTLRDSVLHGDLVIVGVGDPTFGTAKWGEALAYEKVMAQYVAAVEKAGIRRIVGRVLVDDRRYSANAIPSGWLWEDIGNYYGAACYSLNVLDNAYRLAFMPGQVGDTAWTLDTDPDLYEIRFQGAVVTAGAGTGDNAFIYGSPFDTLRFLAGTIPQGAEFAIRGSLPYPPLFFAQRLTAALALRGILTTQPAGTAHLLGLQPKPKPFPEPVAIRSADIRELIRLTNYWSVNLFAEALLKAAAFQRDSATTHAAAEWSLQRYLKAKGVPTTGLRATDGSGLSRLSQATPANVTGLLRYMHTHKDYAAYYASLAQAGKDGISRRLKVAGPNVVRLKGGSFAGAASFAGYVEAPGGKRYAFCIVANGFQARYSTVRDKLAEVLQLLATG